MKKQKVIKFRVPVPGPNQAHKDRKKYNRKSYDLKKDLRNW